jgi:hypothetical protein
MSVLRVMSARREAEVAWDRELLERGDPEAVAAVREAERIFREQREAGGTAYRVTTDGAPVRLDQFDQTAEQIVLVPRVVGG